MPTTCHCRECDSMPLTRLSLRGFIIYCPNDCLEVEAPTENEAVEEWEVKNEEAE